MYQLTALYLFCLLYLFVNFRQHCFCRAQECDSATSTTTLAPQAVVGGQLVTIDDTRFSKYYGVYPPKETAKKSTSTELHYYVLNSDKPILYVPNFLNQSLIEELINICSAEGRFAPSPFRGNTTSEDHTSSSASSSSSSVQQSKLRTSESCMMVPTVAYRRSPTLQAMLKQDPLPPHIAKIQHEMDVTWEVAVRASRLLDVDANTVEPLQLVRYTSPEAEYKVHHDHGGYYNMATEARPWTMLVFLNDVLEGGHTSFPKLDLEVMPRSGDALMWSNVKIDQKTGNLVADEDMVHAGKPPERNGIQKYAMNIWFGFESSEHVLNQAR